MATTKRLYSKNKEKRSVMGLGMYEILMILAVVLILFGAKKIPELARSVGRASYEFKRAKEELVKETRELEEAIAENVEVTDKANKA